MLMAVGLKVYLWALEIAVGIAAAVNKESFKDQLRKAMKASKDNYDVTTAEDRKVWAQLQSKVREFTGVDGPNDWVMGGLYPESCCKTSQPSSPDRLCGPSKEYVYKDGCFNKLSKRLTEGSLIVMGVGIGIALIELAGIVLACLLAQAIKKETEEEEKE
ncbi:CD63 antigen, putative [Pediculus humanus corporis]|uniref:CD63 antigen, putative n=1 Tax=Pediculus humanus subsp. corporis TaxID=121224 RepID=E0V8Z1_PEDHC|nr:CD63 antigen, putative [Pediculus humanus corporis]EEB09847.1 CD63 antigen, putative [Pediculus humanus corporis]